MRAWVISATSLDAFKSHDYDTISEVVLAIISARRRTSFLVDYVAAIKTIILTTLHKQKDFARYNHPATRCHISNDTGCQISWFHHPYTILAQQSNLIDICEIDGWPWLKWQGVGYHRFLEDPVTHQFKTREKVEPPLKFAPQAKVGVNTERMFGRGTYSNPWR